MRWRCFLIMSCSANGGKASSNWGICKIAAVLFSKYCFYAKAAKQPRSPLLAAKQWRRFQAWCHVTIPAAWESLKLSDKQRDTNSHRTSDMWLVMQDYVIPTVPEVLKLQLGKDSLLLRDKWRIPYEISDIGNWFECLHFTAFFRHINVIRITTWVLCLRMRFLLL